MLAHILRLRVMNQLNKYADDSDLIVPSVNSYLVAEELNQIFSL